LIDLAYLRALNTRGVQMALRTVGLNRANDGWWFARKAIPEDVREERARLYGVRREAQLKLSGDMPRHEAKVQLAEWTADVETRIATLRAQKKGEGQAHCYFRDGSTAGIRENEKGRHCGGLFVFGCGLVSPSIPNCCNTTRCRCRATPKP